MASWGAALGMGTAPCGVMAPPVSTMSAAVGASKGGGEKKGLLDWLIGALDKESFSETDPILQKVEGSSGGGRPPSSPSPSKKPSSPSSPKRPSNEGGGGGGGLFGLFGKK